MEKVQLILMVVGAVALGLPALLRAILVVLQMIPGEQGEAFFEKMIAVCDKIASVVSGLYPQSKQSPQSEQPKA